MEQIKQFINQLKITRAQVEIFSVIILLVLGLSVITINHKSKTALTYNRGQIKYTGYVINHRMNGQGTLVYANGDKYVGDFKQGVFEGKGTFTSKTGWSYKGDFKKGQADGKGTLMAKNNKVYKGTFKQGIFQK
ncbi:hypothetical protein ACVRZD_09430 [Streptococcus hongkongensis]|nr:membrane protein [Streptococcus uberis]